MHGIPKLICKNCGKKIQKYVGRNYYGGTLNYCLRIDRNNSNGIKAFYQHCLKKYI